MRAWVVDEPAPIAEGPLRLAERPAPEPEAGEVRVRVSVCGVCRTDLHVVEGDLPPRRETVVPGHEVVGRVEARGAGAGRFEVGDRVGIAWLHRTCGRCRFCRSGRENLCLDPAFTGWTEDGGYAELVTAPEAFVYPLPAGLGEDRQVAPLLCAGIVGYRALRRAALPPGGSLGIWGFGGSAHIVAQVAVAAGAGLHVVTRSEESRALARELGAVWTGTPGEPPPTPLDAAVVFAPVGEVVPEALAALDRGGTVSLAGIHMSRLPPLDYGTHLFQERTLRSTTANTRADGEEFLRVAARVGVTTTTTAYPFGSADRALKDLGASAFAGAAVLEMEA